MGSTGSFVNNYAPGRHPNELPQNRYSSERGGDINGYSQPLIVESPSTTSYHPLSSNYGRRTERDYYPNDYQSRDIYFHGERNGCSIEERMDVRAARPQIYSVQRHTNPYSHEDNLHMVDESRESFPPYQRERNNYNQCY